MKNLIFQLVWHMPVIAFYFKMFKEAGRECVCVCVSLEERETRQRLSNHYYFSNFIYTIADRNKQAAPIY